MTKTEVFIQKAKAIHSDRYEYSRTVYITARSKVEIICPVHGVFSQRGSHHLRGQGCPKCQHERLWNKTRFTREEIIERFVEVHGNRYDYSMMNYVNAATKITILCPIHGPFEIAPYRHLYGKICQKCSRDIMRRNGNGVSKTSNDWLSSLNIPSLIPEFILPENVYRSVDGYDPVTNTVYQFHGDYWHGNPVKYAPDIFNQRAKKTMGELYENTIRMDQQILDWGYHLVTMWEYDWVNRGT